MRVAGYLRHDSMCTDANESIHATHSSVLLSFFFVLLSLSFVYCDPKESWMIADI